VENNNPGYSHSLNERVAILETQMIGLKEIEQKLDQLIELKARGMGALGLVGLIIGSGVLGIIATFIELFKNKGHL
jgi:hypothetical protein